MPTPEDREANAGACEWFAAGATLHGSPFYAALLAHMAADVRRDGPVGRLLAETGGAPIEDAVALRLLGGTHRGVLDGELPALAAHFPTTGGDGDAAATYELLAALLADPPEVIADALRRPPQTNEVGRSAALVTAFLTVADETGLPLRLRELGASGGLNLLVDRYRYEQDGDGWGDPTSPVRFVDLWQGRPPLAVPAVIADRRGCDRDPVPVDTPVGASTLLGYVWPGQDERFALLRAALAVAADGAAPVDRAEIDGWLDEQLADPVAGTATVVFHSIVWQYLAPATRSHVVTALDEAGRRAQADAPLAWVRLEPADGGFPAELRVTTWDGAGPGRERLLATSLFHGGTVDLQT